MTNTPAEFVASVTRSVTAFAPNGHRYVNIESGRQVEAGMLSFDCGHSYLWHPTGMSDTSPLPAPGVHMMCANCIKELLKQY